MQTEDYVNTQNKALNGLSANPLARESTQPAGQKFCLNDVADSNQRKPHRNPKVSFLTSSDAHLERENSGFSV